MTVSKFKDICKVINGRAYKQNELLNDGKYKVLRVGNFFSSDKWYYSDLELDDDKYCDNEDLLFAWSASFGPKIWDGNKVIYHYHIWKLLPKENADKYYLYYWLLNSTNKILAGTHGSVMAHITKSDMENQLINLPSLKIQKQIANIMHNLDKKIKFNNSINNNLEQQAQAIYSNFIDNCDTQTIKVSDITATANTGADAIQKAPIVDYDTGVKCIRVGDMSNNRDIYQWGYSKVTDEVFKQYQLKKDDILVTRTATLGLNRLITSDLNAVYNNGLIRLTVDKSKIYPLFLYRQFQTRDFFNFISRIESETSVRPNMKINYLLGYEFECPEINKQKELIELLMPLMNLIEHNSHQNNRLIQLRDTLLPKLMSGEIDVSNVDISTDKLSFSGL